jgi:D-3-phosphoglycerate dehydrogenase
VSDPIDAQGLEALFPLATIDVPTNLTPEQLIGIIGDYLALMVRSQTQVTAEVLEAGKRLLIVGGAEESFTRPFIN